MHKYYMGQWRDATCCVHMVELNLKGLKFPNKYAN